MAFDITVLGCSGTYGAPGNPCSGFLVRADGASILMDCGPGTLPVLGELVELESLDAVLLSHAHPDHWLELPVLRNALQYVLDRRGLPVYGTAETLALAESLSRSGLGPSIDWHLITDGDDLTVGPVRVRCSRTDHPPETLAFRIDHDGRSIAYSADTGPGWSLTELGEGIDVALCEATYLDPERAGGVHLTATEAGERGREARVGSLVLTHLIPGANPDEYRRVAADAYGAPVLIAEPRRTFTP